MSIDLPSMWVFIILFGIMMYVFLDGFDLGIGILFPFVADKADRDVMMNTVAPVWDGNETWLVLGGAGMLAAFPLAYSVIFSAFYLPLILMLIGLICRGAAFEFRFKASEQRQHFWDKSFAGGSVVATFFQGAMLGAYINGIATKNGVEANGALDWLTPFSLFTGMGLMAAFALLGSTWLIMKTEGRLQDRVRKLALKLVWAVLAAIAVISIWSPLAHPYIAERWFSIPNLFWLSPVPVLVALSAYGLVRSLRSGAESAPFLWTLFLVFLGYGGLGISLWPNIVPPEMTIWDAAGPPQSLSFALVGAVLIIPVILCYTAFSYWVFRGKVRVGEGYH